MCQVFVPVFDERPSHRPVLTPWSTSTRRASRQAFSGGEIKTTAGMLFQRPLRQHLHLSLLDPARIERLERRPVGGTVAVDLAALHGRMNFWRALIAGDDLELVAEHVVGQNREIDCVEPGACAPTITSVVARSASFCTGAVCHR